MGTARLFATIALSWATAAGAADKPKLPPFANAYQPQGKDERGVWAEADEDERKLRDSAVVVRDPALTDDVRNVLCRTVGADRCAGARVYVVRDPAFNAFMAPNGMTVVYTGLLLRVRDEAELAAVMGHEFAHFEQRHSLNDFRHRRGMTDILAWATLAGGSLGYAVSTSAVGSVFAYDRNQEREADALGERFAASANYDAHAAADVWGRIMDEADATALGRRQRSHRYDRVAFFADHPTELERAATMRKLADQYGVGGDTGQAPFVAAVKSWRSQLLGDQLKLNDFGGTEYLLEQLARNGWSEDLLFARAELYRTRGNPRDLVSAAGLYREAIALDPSHAESHRGLGLSLLRGGDAAGGSAALTRYLALKPTAPDAAMIATLIQ